MFKIMAIITVVASLASGWAGWAWRDALCDEASARRDLAAEKLKVEQARLELKTANDAAKTATDALNTINRMATNRQEAIDDLVQQLADERSKEPETADSKNCTPRRRPIGDDGLRRLRKIAPD